MKRNYVNIQASGSAFSYSDLASASGVYFPYGAPVEYKEPEVPKKIAVDIDHLEHKCEYCGASYKMSEHMLCPVCGGDRPTIQEVAKLYE